MAENVSISFPNLGIELENLKKTFSIFGFDIAFYGIIILCGMVVAMLLAFHDARRTGQKVDNYLDLALYGIIFAIVGARLYYVIFEWSYYKDHLLEIFDLRKGGLAIYGGIIAGVLVCIVLATRRKLSVWQMLDTGAIGLITGQMIGRWGNFFNREAYGGDTNSLFAMRININDPNAVVNVQPGVTIIDNSYIQVHPTFLYESFWCFCILIFIQCFKRKKKFYGEVFLWYITAYGFGRFFIEGLRTDQLIIGNTGIAVSQVLSAVVFLIGLFLIIFNRIRLAEGKTPFLVGKPVSPVEHSIDFARKAHKGQRWKLKAGKHTSYFKGHLMGIYDMMKNYGVEDEEILTTIMLHDIVEDTGVNVEKIREKFGEDVADNVRWLTRKKGASYTSYIDELAENGSDTAVIVKMADRLYNTTYLDNIDNISWQKKKLKQAHHMIQVFSEREFSQEKKELADKLISGIQDKVSELEVQIEGKEKGAEHETE